MEICSRSLFYVRYAACRGEKGEAMLKEVSAQGRYADKFVPLRRFYLIVVL